MEEGRQAGRQGGGEGRRCTVASGLAGQWEQQYRQQDCNSRGVTEAEAAILARLASMTAARAATVTCIAVTHIPISFSKLEPAN